MIANGNKTESTSLKMVNCVCFSMHGKALQSRSIIILISIEIYFACFKSMLATVLVRKTVDLIKVIGIEEQ